MEENMNIIENEVVTEVMDSEVVSEAVKAVKDNKELGFAIAAVATLGAVAGYKFWKKRKKSKMVEVVSEEV